MTGEKYGQKSSIYPRGGGSEFSDLEFDFGFEHLNSLFRPRFELLMEKRRQRYTPEGYRLVHICVLSRSLCGNTPGSLVLSRNLYVSVWFINGVQPGYGGLQHMQEDGCKSWCKKTSLEIQRARERQEHENVRTRAIKHSIPTYSETLKNLFWRNACQLCLKFKLDSHSYKTCLREILTNTL